MKVEVFACPYDKKNIADQDYPARGNSEHVISEHSNSGDSQVRKMVMKREVIDSEGLK